MRKIAISAMCSLMYHIPNSKDDCIWLSKVAVPSKVVKNVKLEIKLRVLNLFPTSSSLGTPCCKCLLENV